MLLITRTLSAQNQVTATDEFIITGKVKSDKKVDSAELQKYHAIELNDINTGCSPRKEEKTKSVKAVLLKDILDSVAFQYDKPRMLNEYYFLFVASDGYKIVFSFNEIYNTDTGTPIVADIDYFDHWYFRNG